MPIVETNDINLYYEMHGNGEPLVLIAGFTLNHLAWREFIAPLSEHFQVIALDNRGCGQSDTPDGGYHPQMFVEDIIGLLNHLQIESAHFMGESMGTTIIQRLCLDHPDRVKKAILCAPFAKCPTATLFNLALQLKLLQSGIDRMTLVELNAPWLLSNTFLSNPENIKRYLNDYQANPFPTTLEGIISQANALKSDLSKEIKNILHEVLLIVGEQDITSPLYCAEFMHQTLPNSKLDILKEMGHEFIYEVPEIVAKKAIHFLLQK